MLQQRIFENFPFDVIRLIGNDSVDFLQRITTNDFGKFNHGDIQKTLVINEKGRVIDAVWVVNRETDLLILCSYKMGDELIAWLNKFIIMEDIVLENVSAKYAVNLFFEVTENNKQTLQTEYFGTPAYFEIHEKFNSTIQHPDESFEQWRIEEGIPVTKKELVTDYNPLELNLWDWISFTKGCYIGQEVIARLDTYNKIQRTLCLISSPSDISENEVILDEEKKEVGKITSVVRNDFKNMGLAVIRSKYAILNSAFSTQRGNKIQIVKVFQKEMNGRN